MPPSPRLSAGGGSAGASTQRLPYPAVLLSCAALLTVACTIAVSLGAISIPLTTVWAIVARQSVGLDLGLAIDPTFADVVWTLRAPRVALAALVGAGLALAGTAAQALARNALAEPYILGVSSGASVGAVATIVFGLGLYGQLSTSAAAFIGALASMLLVALFGRRGGVIAPLRLVLAGVSVGYFLQGITSFLVLQAPEAHQVYGILFWLAGNLAQSDWRYLPLPALAVLLALLALMVDGQRLNALAVGDETAASLGVDVNRLRARLLILASLLTAVMVSLSGAIGFVGLVVPHVARMLVGSDHRRVIPATVLIGAAFLVVCDAVGRLLLAPVEIPVGIITGMAGAPFFLWLLRQTDAIARV